MARSRSVSSDTNLSTCLQRMDYGRGFRHELGMDKKLDTPFSKPLVDAISLFDRLGIGYALVGGVAAMYYGRPRITEDVDFVAQSGHPELLSANPDAMRQFGFDPACTWKLYHDSGVDIDIWKDEFAEDIVHRATTAKFGDHDIRIAEVHDLVAMKLRAGRFLDDYDVSEMIKNNALDRDLIRSRVTAEQFARFEQIEARVRSESAK